ncbi:MAG: hypothetical protein DRQ42_04805 [Gammaproteobacteria bacterium]|nr:MAG: hypothetical protein DRQ42_04805 [Gammaproteobacteria bacterium]
MIDEYSAYKHPDSEVDFGRNWGDNPDTDEAGWLHPDEVIINSVWVISSLEENPVALVEASQGTSISSNGKMTTIFLEGGTSGKQYVLTNTIITTDNNGIVRKQTKEAILNVKRGC